MDANRLVTMLASTLIAFACAAQEADVPEVKWQTEYAAAIEKAHKAGKPVLIDFYADWCGPCRMMDQQTFTDARVARATDAYVAIRVNVDQNQDVAYAYRIQGIPRTIILNVYDQMVGDRVGFLDAEEYVAFLGQAEEFTHKKMEGEAVKMPKSRAESLDISAGTAPDALLEYLGDPDPAVRKKAREELTSGHRSADDVKAVLTRAMAHQYLGVRVAAWEILAETVSGAGLGFDPWARPSQSDSVTTRN